ncbi:SDR family oxidoreductase [Roseibacillus ishigakijimensis]|uniref:SDR family oxidoreductase n=1 Tax=Roseibacillus ishigakijimensis TaxID=454146 RepID=A0A934RR13_9BACT|nr:SDR family oxidoreductase [Roseibacillus ishigakijimensis]MBK1832956.1 SDR family oxidoreductase [Roseibacillus ishigakijimensis]
MAKTVWITGCSRGLGLEMTKGFQARGWQVAGCARRLGEMGEGFFRAVDVCDERAVREFCLQAAASTEAPDLLINNAAVINEPRPLWEVTGEDFDRTIDVNIKGVANFIRAAVPLMIARGTGVVVNFSSGWGRSVSAQVAPYCATKWAMEGLSQALAEELPSGLAAVALNPGIIDTEMLRKTWGEGAAGFPSAEEWGRVAVPFLEQLSSRDNGASLTVS